MIKGKEIEFSDGGKRIVPPLSLGAVEAFQEKLKGYSGGMGDVGLVIDVSHAALTRNYPGITRTEVADLIDLSNMNAVMFAVMNVSGLVPADPGEVPAAAAANP